MFIKIPSLGMYHIWFVSPILSFPLDMACILLFFLFIGMFSVGFTNISKSLAILLMPGFDNTTYNLQYINIVDISFRFLYTFDLFFAFLSGFLTPMKSYYALGNLVFLL